MDNATIIGIVSAIIALLSILISVIAIWVTITLTIKSDDIAQTANQIARDANETSRQAIEISKLGIRETVLPYFVGIYRPVFIDKKIGHWIYILNQTHSKATINKITCSDNFTLVLAGDLEIDYPIVLGFNNGVYLPLRFNDFEDDLLDVNYAEVVRSSIMEIQFTNELGISYSETLYYDRKGDIFIGTVQESRVN